MPDLDHPFAATLPFKPPANPILAILLEKDHFDLITFSFHDSDFLKNNSCISAIGWLADMPRKLLFCVYDGQQSIGFSTLIASTGVTFNQLGWSVHCGL